MLALNNTTLITDRCDELRRTRSTVDGVSRCACPYLNAAEVTKQQVTDHLLAQPTPVDDVAQLAQQNAVCGYYTARAVTGRAEVITFCFDFNVSQSFIRSLKRSLHCLIQCCCINQLVKLSV